MIEVVMARRDRFGRKIGGAVSCSSTNGHDLATFVEKQVLKGVPKGDENKQRRDKILSKQFELETEE
jgi:hypothetical protein